MSRPSQSYTGTYFVQDQQNEEELQRIASQDHLVTASMGGVLAEQHTPERLRRVLDVACGVGGWAREAARTYPTMTVVGIDLNPWMVAYAREQAVAQGLEKQVTFQVMDALRALDFPDTSFDLINLRFAVSFVRTWEWPRLLGELWRILRPGGVMRLTDEEIIHQSSSPAAMQFCTMLLCALYQSGHLFDQESAGLTSHLASLLTQQGYRQVDTRSYALHYQAGTPEGEAYARDGVQVVRTLRPFLEKWGCISTDYESLHLRVSTEVAHPGFSATWNLLTAWASKP